MKKTMIRLLSLMLCLITVVSLLPVSAAAAKQTIGAPKNLTWNREWDPEQQKLVTKYGVVSWQFTKPLPIPFAKGEPSPCKLRLYRDGEMVFETVSGYRNMNSTQYYSYDFRSEIKEPGTYYFKIYLIAVDEGQNNSKTVTSGKWTYSGEPDTQVAPPTNAGWDWPNAVWDGDGDFQVDMYYSPTKVTKADDLKQMQPLIFHTSVQGNSAGYGLPGGMAGYYRYRIRTLSPNITKTAHSDWVLSEIYHLPLKTPEVKVTKTSSGKPKISWETLSEPSNVEVYRSTSEKGSYTKIKTVKYNADISPERNVRSYTDEDAVRGRTYYYKVRAVTNMGVKSSYSKPIEFVRKLSRPTVKITNSASSGKIRLTWNQVSGAKEYQIYRATEKDGEYKLMMTTTSTSYTNTSAKAGKRYYYKVKAIGRSAKASSNFSEVVNRLCDLERPDVNITRTSKGKPRLTWDAVEGAKEYEIYRATSKNGEYKKIKTVTKTSFNNTGAKAGKTYYYKVKAICTNTNANSAFSAVQSVKSK